MIFSVQNKRSAPTNDKIDDVDFDPYSDYQPKPKKEKAEKVSSESDEGELQAFGLEFFRVNYWSNKQGL